MADPVPVIPLEYARPEAATSRIWRGIIWTCHLLALLCCAVAWTLLVFVEVESVVITGAMLFILGVLLLVGGAITRPWRAAGFGAAHVAVCVLFVALVNLRNWSPHEAEAPFTAMGAAYTAGALVTALLWRSAMFRPG